jgi:hypothetical protein
MMRNRRLPHRETPAQPAASHFSLLSDMLENLEPSGIGQCFGDSLKLLCIHERPISLCSQ